MTTTCFYLVYAMSTICYQQQPVPQLQPLPPPAGYVTPGPASVYQGSDLSVRPVIPTWQDILRQQNGSDDE
jgi:hypothetical protein